jgi:hypothetical protein
VLRDNDIEYLDAMIDAYAAVAAYVERLPELEEKITEAYRSVCAARPEFDSFNSLIGGGRDKREQWARHVAWVSQHVFGNRAHCVGNKILLSRDGQFASPLIEQLSLQGYEPYKARLPSAQVLVGSPVDALKQIDAMVVDRPTNTVFVVKGLVYERATLGRLRPVVAEPSLFAPVAPGQSQMYVPRKRIGCLGLAYAALKYAFPRLRVVPVVLVVDDPFHGWGFEAYDVTPAMTNLEECKPRSLAEYERIASTSDLRHRGVDSDELRYLPKWALVDPFNLLPTDRATRSLIALNIIWNKQREHVDRLAVVRASAIGDMVRGKYHIEYPSDLRRHDLEDCLERGGLIERPAFEGNAYALTPKGLARLLLARRLFEGRLEMEDDEDVRSHILNHVHRQAELWARYRSGTAICV